VLAGGGELASAHDVESGQECPGAVLLRVQRGDPSTPADEADVSITTLATEEAAGRRLGLVGQLVLSASCA
jgi:hypothetical protein